MKPPSSLLCLLQVLCTLYNLFVARASATLIKCPPCRYIVTLIWGRRKFHTSLLRIRQIKSVLFSLIFANDKQILFWPTGSTPHVILESQTPQTPISTSGLGYIWWSIQFDRVVRIKRLSLANHFTYIPLFIAVIIGYCCCNVFFASTFYFNPECIPTVTFSFYWLSYWRGLFFYFYVLYSELLAHHPIVIMHIGLH